MPLSPTILSSSIALIDGGQALRIVFSRPMAPPAPIPASLRIQYDLGAWETPDLFDLYAADTIDIAKLGHLTAASITVELLARDPGLAAADGAIVDRFSETAPPV